MEIIEILANGETLAEDLMDHQLAGGYKCYRECHIQPNWLLIYKKTERDLVLTLTRTGSHSDFF